MASPIGGNYGVTWRTFSYGGKDDAYSFYRSVRHIGIYRFLHRYIGRS